MAPTREMTSGPEFLPCGPAEAQLTRVMHVAVVWGREEMTLR